MPGFLEHAAHSWKGRHVRGAESVVNRFDPRARIVAAVMLAAVTVLATRHAVMAAGLVLALLTAAARLAVRATVKRLATMELLILLMIAMLPFTTPGTPFVTIGPLVGTVEGAAHAFGILLKANAVVLFLLALVGTMEAVTLGHALARLGAPHRWVHILLFTVRYLEVIGREYKRMRNAMKARAFRPRSDLHTWRSVGYLLGMLLVRSLDRAHRILAAMKCRGYTGRLHLIDDMAAGRLDAALMAGVLVIAGGMAWLDWTWG